MWLNSQKKPVKGHVEDHEGILFDLVSIVSVVIYISSSQKYLQWFEEKGNKNAQKCQINIASLLSIVLMGDCLNTM